MKAACPSNRAAAPTALTLEHEVRPVRTALLAPYFPDKATRAPEAAMEEAEGLCQAINLDLQWTEQVRMTTPRPATLIGGGKIEEIAAAAEGLELELMVVDAALTPTQQRNLERATGLKVIDRTGLILEIFGERARTREGRLQVELAHLNYQRSRLVRSWTHLERQRGGAGFMGGPGESQIELDRRMIDDRIVQLEKALEKVRRTRELHRKPRRDTPYPVVALVGYTNAGKSTLFNRLSGANVFAKDLLFATLDPTMRAVELTDGRPVIMSDTVGFVANLPTELVAAFRATLEEVVEADIILHVRDASDPEMMAQADDVYAILESMGIEAEGNHTVVEVFNKLDLLAPENAGRMRDIAAAMEHPGVIISALTGAGLDDLSAEVARRLARDKEDIATVLDPASGADIAWLYRNGEILGREDLEDGIHLTVRLSQADAGRWRKRHPA